MEVKVQIEAATKEIESWLDFNKIMPLEREQHDGSIKILIEGLQYGLLSLKDNAFTQNLHFPIGDTKIAAIEYKARITSFQVNEKMKTEDKKDANGLIVSVWAALSEQPKQIYKVMDKADKRIANAIVIFFLET